MIDTVRPTETQLGLIQEFNDAVKAVMVVIMKIPTSREASCCFTRLEEAESWGVKAILYNVDKDVKEENRPAIAIQ